jgi:hypothetical protein
MMQVVLKWAQMRGGGECVKGVKGGWALWGVAMTDRVQVSCSSV